MMIWIRLRQGRCSLLPTDDEPEVSGPIFGPFLTIHENRGRDIRCGEVWRLRIVNGSVFYGGVYYRAWDIFRGSVRDCELDRICCFSPDLAKLPGPKAADQSSAVVLFD